MAKSNTRGLPEDGVGRDVNRRATFDSRLDEEHVREPGWGRMKTFR